MPLTPANGMKIAAGDWLETLGNSVQSTTQERIQKQCLACVHEEQALRKLWVQIQERAHPTDFTWHCLKCGKENHIVID